MASRCWFRPPARWRWGCTEVAGRLRRARLDAFLLKAKSAYLSPRALELKRQIEKKTAAAAPEKKAG